MIGFWVDPNCVEQFHKEADRKKISLQQASKNMFVSNQDCDLVWALQKWSDIQITKFKTISEAAQMLQSHPRQWMNSSESQFRRSELIQSKVDSYYDRPIDFYENCKSVQPKLQQKNKKLGAWMLTTPETLLYSCHVDPAVPKGIFKISEDSTAPSRAYLKLMEAFLRIGIWPHPKDFCIDLGAAPGGWTHVLAKLGCSVKAVDKASLELDPKVKSKVNFVKADVFKLKPTELECDWLVSDVICYPEKLYQFLTEVLAAKKAKNLVFTIKFQGSTDFAAIDRFAAIPGSKLFHSSHNKHELTWAHLHSQSVGGV